MYNTLALHLILTSTQPEHVEKLRHICQYRVPFITCFCRWCCLDAAGGETVSFEMGSGHLYTVSFSVAVVADTLYHLTVAVETDMGIVP